MTLSERRQATMRVNAMLCFMTTTDLYKLSGVSITTLNRIELGGLPQDATFDKIAGAWQKFMDQQQEILQLEKLQRTIEN